LRFLRVVLQEPKQYLASALFWLLLTYPMLKWWKESVLFVAVMSLYTIVKSELVGATATELSEKDIARIVAAIEKRGLLTHPGGTIRP
jgi:hypothetical protein